jgi:hypothetical protein
LKRTLGLPAWRVILRKSVIAPVREKLDYAGQTAKPINPRPDHLDDAHVQSVIARHLYTGRRRGQRD